MYMIAGLCMLKLYQKRHPDINASAYTAYACLAAVIFFSVLGVVSATHTHTIQNLSYALWSKNMDFLIIIVLCFFSSQVFGRDNTAFWIVFSVIHILATLLLSTQLYYMGRWRLSKITERKQTQSSGLYWLKMSHFRLITDCN